MVLHRCPSCRTHVGWPRIFFPQPAAAWSCASCSAPLCWVDPPRRAKLLLCTSFGAAVVVALIGLSASGLDGAARLLSAIVLALVLGVLCQVCLARVGLASRS